MLVGYLQPDVRLFRITVDEADLTDGTILIFSVDYLRVVGKLGVAAFRCFFLRVSAWNVFPLHSKFANGEYPLTKCLQRVQSLVLVIVQLEDFE